MTREEYDTVAFGATVDVGIVGVLVTSWEHAANTMIDRAAANRRIIRRALLE
jgi:hypothetical protein